MTIYIMVSNLGLYYKKNLYSEILIHGQSILFGIPVVHYYQGNIEQTYKGDEVDFNHQHEEIKPVCLAFLIRVYEVFKQTDIYKVIIGIIYLY